MSDYEITLASRTTDTIAVVELFGPTIQGEGLLAGQVSYFLRTGYCGYKCSWCDSLHAVTPALVSQNARWLTAQDIILELNSKRSAARFGRKVKPWITLTGGDPVLWDLAELVKGLGKADYRIAVETQGQLWRDWLEDCDVVTLSPKPPSSGMADKLDVSKLQKYHARLPGKLALKIVIFNQEDLEFAARIRRIVPDVPFYLSAGTDQEVFQDGQLSADEQVRLGVCAGFRELAERVCGDPRFHDATVLPQLHVLAWGRDLGR